MKIEEYEENLIESEKRKNCTDIWNLNFNHVFTIKSTNEWRVTLTFFKKEEWNEENETLISRKEKTRNSVSRFIFDSIW